MLTLNKIFLLHIVLFCSILGFSQENKKEETVWKQERKSIQYKKGEKYKGPSDWYTSEPGSIDEKIEDEQPNEYQGLDYQPEQIQRDRNIEKDGFDRGGGEGTESYDPDVLSPDFETPEIDSTTEPDSGKSIFSDRFWKTIGILILFVLVIFIIYQIIKNSKSNPKAVNVASIDRDWNPTVITKTELELLLEKAIEEEDYRECVRIYFNFILKELIKKGWIKWKKEKTNYNYILEMKSHPNSFQFEECVRIYDFVWYGEYQLTKAHFEEIQPVLFDYYKLIEKDDK